MLIFQVEISNPDVQLLRLFSDIYCSQSPNIQSSDEFHGKETERGKGESLTIVVHK